MYDDSNASTCTRGTRARSSWFTAGQTALSGGQVHDRCGRKVDIIHSTLPFEVINIYSEACRDLDAALM